MTEPGSEAGGQSHLRVSHAEREQVIDALKTAFVEGRLDWDEFSQRVDQAQTSRTYADLAPLIADIPVRLVRAQPPQPAGESVSKTAVVTMAFATTALVGLWPVMMMTPPWPAFVLPVAVIWFALVVAVPAGWLVLLRDWFNKSGVLRPAPGLGGPHIR